MREFREVDSCYYENRRCCRKDITRLRMKYRSNVEIMALMIENMKGSGAAQEILGMSH